MSETELENTWREVQRLGRALDARITEHQHDRDYIETLRTDLTDARQQLAGAVKALELIEAGRTGVIEPNEPLRYFSVRDCRRIAREALAAIGAVR